VSAPEGARATPTPTAGGDGQLWDLPVTWLEVFAEAPLGGNLHAVVHDADVLDPATMAAFAARLRLSETSYVLAAGTDGADYRHRIFTFAGEIPFAGHPSLGAATAVARHRGSARADLVQETGAGLQPLSVAFGSGGRSATAEMGQNAPELLAEPDPAPLLSALGLAPEDRHPSMPAEVISTGLPTLVLPVRELAVLGRIGADLTALGPALAGAGAVTCYLVALPGPASGGRWRARCFTDRVAGGEDAATGSAAGPLAAYAHRHLGLPSIEVDQGLELGSPSRLRARVEGDHVVVGGNVRVLGNGVVSLPASGAA
jgi:trans-2,3-dihydro-3-hydroxyanthranilate isomerase